MPAKRGKERKRKHIKNGDEAIKLLDSNVLTYLTGKSSVWEVLGNGYWGTFDPLGGLFQKATKPSAQHKIETAKELIRYIYSEYPELTKRILEEKVTKIWKKDKDWGIKLRLLLEWLEKDKEKKEDPLRILQLRYAKGEITVEEFEEMKKTLES